MPFLPDARCLSLRALGVVRRGGLSLRVRGWRASWQRVRDHIGPRATAASAGLYQPAPDPFAPFAVPTAPAPRASIVIPVYNHFAHTLACLRALAAHPPRVAFEVIVVDDGSNDETAACLPRIAGVS